MKEIKYSIVLLISIFHLSLFAQNDGDNMTELYHHDVSGQTYNDCWGYVDDAGNEYAIVGTRTRIYFYDITDPENTVLIDEFYNGSETGLTMASSTWRDFKTYEDKAYAVSGSGTEGLIIFDLSDLPNSVIFEEQTASFFNYSHSIFIDTLNGFLYTAGANVQNNGTRILDLNTDPITIEGNASLSGGYIHDIHVRDGLAYCFSGNDGMYVYDFSADPDSPDYLGDLTGYSGNGYNHSGWLTDSGDHIIFCDETVSREVKMCDVTDHGNMAITDQFHSNGSVSGTIAHNPFVKGDYVYVSYYNDGVYVYDITDPTDVTTHAYYDTNPGDVGGGCWGVYPYFPSGSIIATDIALGFYVLQLENGSLPVELSSFDAISEEEKVKLEWTTISEKNSAFFEVERSSDGLEFESIAKLDGQGNSEELINYLTYDESPLKGNNYYRLKQIDQDGKFEYSEIRNVYFGVGIVEVFPSYIGKEQSLKVLFTETISDMRFDLYTVQGQLLKSYLRSGVQGEELSLRLEDVQNGTYVLHASNEYQEVTKRIVIAR